MSDQARLKTEGKLLAISFVVSSLLALYVKRSEGKLDELHSALVQQAFSSIKSVGAGDMAFADVEGGLEAAVTNELDSIFSLADLMLRRME